VIEMLSDPRRRRTARSSSAREEEGHGVRLMGFGHRVYKNYDPRAADPQAGLLRGARPARSERPAARHRAASSSRSRSATPTSSSRKLYPNVDFYSGIIYKALGIPVDMFTVFFAIGRMPGWIAHWLEIPGGPEARITRPRQIYMGGGVYVGNPDPSTDADGVAGGGVAGVVIGGTASTAMHPDYWLTSPVLPAPAQQGLTLSFDRFLNTDYAPYMDSRVEVFDGANWNAIFVAGELYDAEWTTMIFDVQQAANPGFRVRFGVNVGSPAVYTVSSWNVDNVRMSMTTPVPTVGAYAPFGGGTGSLGIAIVAGPPNAVAITAVAIGGGNVPNGWFYGVDILYFDLVLQAFSGAPPFVVVLDGQGRAQTEIPAGVPAGLPLGIVTVPLVGGLPSAATAPILFVTH
jgi:hypothetical protein